LNVVTLRIPPLRERQEDIPLLAQHFLEKYAKQNRKRIKGFTPLAIDMLLKYNWPGNVRELENAVERAVILLPGDFVSEKELPLNITESYPQTEGVTVQPAMEAQQADSLEEIEKRAILATLEATDGNKTAAAKRLGITRKTLHKKLVKYGEI
jgi:two-component system response regulator HydG